MKSAPCHHGYSQPLGIGGDEQKTEEEAATESPFLGRQSSVVATVYALSSQIDSAISCGILTFVCLIAPLDDGVNGNKPTALFQGLGLAHRKYSNISTHYQHHLPKELNLVKNRIREGRSEGQPAVRIPTKQG